jgi:hypothetical protein
LSPVSVSIQAKGRLNILTQNATFSNSIWVGGMSPSNYFIENICPKKSMAFLSKHVLYPIHIRILKKKKKKKKIKIKITKNPKI